jgi:HAD superfamily hydrolase (TIGR01484 family)
MPFTLLAEAAGTAWLKNIRLVAADMDGTLTQQGKFTAPLLQALEDLASSGIQVVIVTGRSAGWVSGLATYLPISGAIAENGGLFYSNTDEAGEMLLISLPEPVVHRQKLAQMFRHLQAQFPHIQASKDNRFRVTDWTFDNQDLSLTEMQQMAMLCEQQGWGFTYSNVQCHIKPPQQSKAAGLLTILNTVQKLQHSPDQILTVGDSPNDESLFNPEVFPLSVGVANALVYREQMLYQPAYVTSAAEGLGFCELVSYLLF